MRMAGPDIILFVVGLLLFGGAGYAIIGTGPSSSLGVFNVAWDTSEEDVDTLPVDSFRDGTLTFDVTQQNVTLLVFTVTCTDPASAAVPFQWTATITSPNGTASEPQTANCGQDVVIDFALAEVPEPIAVSGTTEAEARENIRLMDNATAAVGTWTIAFTGDRSGAPALPVPVGEPTGSVALSAQTWSPRFSPVQKV